MSAIPSDVRLESDAGEPERAPPRAADGGGCIRGRRRDRRARRRDLPLLTRLDNSQTSKVDDVR